MKFSCESKPLAYALNKCVTLCQKSATYPFIRNVLIETVGENALRITSTDMATMLTYYVTDGVEIKTQGVACVDAYSLTTFISSKVGTVTSYITPADRLMTKLEGNKLSLSQIPSEQFPDRPNLPEEMVVKVSGENLKAILSISFMANRDLLTSALNGTFVVVGDEYLFAMAASHGRMGYAWVPVKYKGTGRFLLPKSTAELLPRLLYDDDDVLIYVKDNKMFFVTDRFRLVCNQLQGNFPYEQLKAMANAPIENEVFVTAEELNSAVSTCLSMSKDVNNKLWKTISFSADTDYHILDISTAKENEIGHMNWSVTIKKHTGTSFSFDLYANFAWDVMRATERARDTELISEFIRLPRISVGYIIYNENKLVRIAESGMNAVFVIAPLGQVQEGPKPTEDVEILVGE